MKPVKSLLRACGMSEQQVAKRTVTYTSKPIPKRFKHLTISPSLVFSGGKAVISFKVITDGTPEGELELAELFKEID